MKFSANVRTLNASVTGAGENGERAAGRDSDTGNPRSGRGGNGGQSIISENTQFTKDTEYLCSVANSGGNSAFNSIVAVGGNTYTGNGAGGARRNNHSGNGYPGSVGTQFYYSAYETKTLCGGGGGGGYFYEAAPTTYETPGAGGAPYGGKGGENATGYGGGGGGAYIRYYDYNDTDTGPVGTGGKGNIAFSMILINL